MGNSRLKRVSEGSKIILKCSVPQSDLVNGGWCPIEVDQTQYLKIDAEYPAMMNQSMPFHDRLAFWNQDFNPSTVWENVNFNVLQW